MLRSDKTCPNDTTILTPPADSAIPEQGALRIRKHMVFIASESLGQLRLDSSMKHSHSRSGIITSLILVHLPSAQLFVTRF